MMLEKVWKEFPIIVTFQQLLLKEEGCRKRFFAFSILLILQKNLIFKVLECFQIIPTLQQS